MTPKKLTKSARTLRRTRKITKSRRFVMAISKNTNFEKNRKKYDFLGKLSHESKILSRFALYENSGCSKTAPTSCHPGTRGSLSPTDHSILTILGF